MTQMGWNDGIDGLDWERIPGIERRISIISGLCLPGLPLYHRNCQVIIHNILLTFFNKNYFIVSDSWLSGGL